MPAPEPKFILCPSNDTGMATHAYSGDEESLLADEFETPIDDRIRALVENRAATLERRIADLETELEELDNFAKITLRDRRIAENTGNIGKVSDTLSGFAESTTEKLNTIQRTQETNTLLLAAIVEALDEEGVDVDLSAVRNHREGRPVTDVSADDRLGNALDG